MFNPKTAPCAQYYLGPLEAVAPKLGVAPVTTPVSSENDIENVVTQLGREQGAGIIMMTDSFMFVHRKLIVELTASHKVPTISFVKEMPLDGGLISYGVDGLDLFARAALYIDLELSLGKADPVAKVRRATQLVEGNRRPQAHWGWGGGGRGRRLLRGGHSTTVT